MTINSEFSYGKKGRPPGAHGQPEIPGNTSLQFEVELISWAKKQKVTEDGRVVKRVLAMGEGPIRPDDGATVTGITRDALLSVIVCYVFVQ